MSTLTTLLPPATQPEIFEIAENEARPCSIAEDAGWNPDRFSQEQVRTLVRQLFFPGTAKPPHHVAFSAVDASTYVAEICMDVAKALALQVSGSVCLIEANLHNPELESVFGNNLQKSVCGREGFGFLRSCSQHICGGLWLAPRRLLVGNTDEGRSPAWLERRLGDFRLEFDYTLLHAPTVGQHSEAVLLGRLYDGIVMVLEANSTKRAAALRAKDMLQASNARLLGTVLSERTFPIPEGIYRRL
jgi:Mrp family chromosome partitioning ATPase